MSDIERDQQDEGKPTEEDAKEDLELKDDDADRVRGGAAFKYDRPESTGKNVKI